MPDSVLEARHSELCAWRFGMDTECDCKATKEDEMTILPEYVVGAIRLALEGAANDEAALSLTKWLVDQAPATPEDDKASVKLLIEGIRELGFSLSTESPSGAYATT